MQLFSQLVTAVLLIGGSLDWFLPDGLHVSADWVTIPISVYTGRQDDARQQLLQSLNHLSDEDVNETSSSHYFRLGRVYQQDYNEISALTNPGYDGQILYRELSRQDQMNVQQRQPHVYTTTNRMQDPSLAGDEQGPFILDAETVMMPIQQQQQLPDTPVVPHFSYKQRQAILTLARMSMYAYWQPPTGDGGDDGEPDDRNDPWYQKKTSLNRVTQSESDHDDGEDGEPEEWIDLDGWKRHRSYGWQGNGLRAHVFQAVNTTTLVVAFKGTSLPFLRGRHDGEPTSINDKLNDNMMFSCCCGRRGIFTKPYCKCQHGRKKCDPKCIRQAVNYRGSYYTAALKIFEHIKQHHPNHTIILTGHSLGGAIASLVATTQGNVPAFAFESPGEAMFATRLGLLDKDDGDADFISPSELQLRRSQAPVWHFGINSDPIYMGTCHGIRSVCHWAGYTLQTQCHLGKRCLFDTLEGLGWLPSTNYHRASMVIRHVLRPWAEPHKSKGNNTSPDEPVLNIPVTCGVEQDCKDCGEWILTMQ
jgi:putative lipase involved disintegration of autophagic bodies